VSPKSIKIKPECRHCLNHRLEAQTLFRVGFFFIEIIRALRAAMESAEMKAA
jgi:hypothetical protein